MVAVSKQEPFLLARRPLDAIMTLGHLIDRHPKHIRTPPLLPIGRDPSAQVQVTASDNERCPPNIPHPGRPPPSRKVYSAISSLVVAIIAIDVLIGGD